MSLAENLSIIDMQFDDPKNKTERMEKLIETKPKLVSIDYMNILPNPPANNSTEVKEELQKLQKYENIENINILKLPETEPPAPRFSTRLCKN